MRISIDAHTGWQADGFSDKGWLSGEFAASAQLNLWRNLRIHQRRAAIGVNDLSSYPFSLPRTKQRRNVADIFRRSQPPHGSPSARVPISDEFLNLLGQRIQYAVFGPSGADGIDCDAAFGESH